MLILGIAPVLIGVFYLMAALFDLRIFFWAIVFGRLGVFLLCMWLRYTRHQASGLLLIAALPDLAGAIWTSTALASSASTALLFALGVGNVMTAAAFALFPAGARTRLGFPEAAGTWLPLTSALLAFWGAYEILASMAQLAPLYWSSVLGHGLFGLTCMVAAVHPGSRGAVHAGRLALAGAGYAAAGVTLAVLVRMGM
jgi:hypothetical protein